ncbi:MAG: hydroxyacid dehydrogenase [Clostridia bacterium]|nr:hydroxyacid dehydrogenase [Clostridia bacterium]
MAVLLKPFGSINWEKQAFKDLLTVVGVEGKKEALSEAEILEKIAEVDVLQADVDVLVTRKILEEGKKLRAVVCTSIGVDYADIEAATDCGVIVCNNPDFCIIAVAEYAIGMMFALVRQIPKGVQAVLDGKWSERARLGGVEFFGKTLGIIGLGKTGREVAVRAKGLGMNILGYSPHAGRFAAASVGAELVSLEELLQKSDFVTIHTSLRKDTRKLIGAKELGLMKENAYLINVARGGIIDEEALAKVLQQRKIAGAALDVLGSEPPEEGNPLIGLDNVIITPHVAWFTKEASLKTRDTTVAQVNAIMKGDIPLHVLNPEVLPFWEKRISKL